MDDSPRFPMPINQESNLDEVAKAIARQNFMQNNVTVRFRPFGSPAEAYLTTVMSNLKVEKESTLVILVGYVTTIFILSPFRQALTRAAVQQARIKAVVQQAPGCNRLEPGTVLLTRIDDGKIDDITGYQVVGVISNVKKDNDDGLKYNVLLDHTDVPIGTPVYCMRPRPQ